MTKKILLLSISAIALFASLFSNTSAFSWTGCTIDPYKTIDWMSAFPNITCFVTWSWLTNLWTWTVSAGWPTNAWNNYNFWNTSNYWSLWYCRFVATTPVSTSVTGSYSTVTCPSSNLSLIFWQFGAWKTYYIVREARKAYERGDIVISNTWLSFPHIRFYVPSDLPPILGEINTYHHQETTPVVAPYSYLDAHGIPAKEQTNWRVFAWIVINQRKRVKT